MKIPKQFSIFGQTYKVKLVDDLVDDWNDKGQAVYRKNEMLLQRNNAGVNRPQTHIEEAFCHELVHFILHAIREDELCDNEKFVTQFSAALHQALSSFKG